jgi:hypothetical protein
VETVPTPGKILPQNRPFLKIPILIGEKPASLAARQNAQKKGRFPSMPGDCPCRMTAIARKKMGILKGRKMDQFFPENEVISSPVPLIRRRWGNGTHDPFRSYH